MKGTLFRGVSELQRNTFTSNSPNYDKLDTDFIVGTAIKFFESKGYTCVWEHLNDDPSLEFEFIGSQKPVIQNVRNAMIKEELRCHKYENGYWNLRKNEAGVIEAESEVFAALDRLLKI